MERGRKGEGGGEEDIAWLVSDSGMEEMRGVRTVDIPAIHPCLKVGHPLSLSPMHNLK